MRINARRPYSEIYDESDADFVNNNLEAAVLLLENADTLKKLASGAVAFMEHRHNLAAILPYLVSCFRDAHKVSDLLTD